MVSVQKNYIDQTTNTTQKVNYKIVYSRCKNAITQKWLGHLTSNQTVTMLYIIDRTLRFNKFGEIILRNYTGNPIINKKTGEEVNCGLPFSSRTYTRVLQQLRELGLVVTQTVTNQHGSANLVIPVVDNILENPMSHLKKSKKAPKTEKSKTGGRATRGTEGRATGGTVELIDKELSNIKSPIANISDDTDFKTKMKNIEVSAQKAVEENARRTKKKSERWNTCSGFVALWSRVMMRHEGKCFTPATSSDWGIYKKRLAKIGKDKVDLPEVMDWAIEHWYNLSKSEFSWAVEKKLMGCTPSATAFCLLFNKFYQVWHSDKKNNTVIVQPRNKQPKQEAPAKQAVHKEYYKPNLSIEKRLGNMKLISGGKKKAKVKDSESSGFRDTLGEVDCDIPKWRDE